LRQLLIPAKGGQLASLASRCRRSLALFNHFIEAPKAAIVPKIGAAQTVTVALAGWAKISDSILIRLRAVTANAMCFDLH
jgi:hypothetical protein